MPRRRRSVYDRGDWVWVPDEAEAWVPARVKRREGGKVVTETADGEMCRWSEREAKDFEECGPLNTEHANLVDLEEFSEGSILHQVRMRFERDQIYTLVGSILVAVNPFKWLSIYSREGMLSYRAKAAASEDAEPHVFLTASRAYQDLLDQGKSQSVLISGESGAGKTETTKKVLSYLTEVAGQASNNVAEQILQSNPVLEAFGNSKTLRNNNSSRFGKWMQIDFDANFKIQGCSIVNYLLEKSRVVGQNADERNYHVFYMLLEGLGASERAELHLGSGPEQFRYLSGSGCYAVEGFNDVEEWAAMMAAFESLQFSGDEVRDIKLLLSSILNLGNLEFVAGRKGDDSAAVGGGESADTLANVAAMLSVDAAGLSQALCFRRRQMGRGSMVMIDLSPAKAAAGRDALAKALYGAMFDWLVTRVNDTLFRGAGAQHIGVLDIFGFEVFDVNSFEQMCINYCNEKLQFHFNECIFEMEMALYREENVDYTSITFQDNAECIQLVEGRPIGLLSLLDEECSLGKGSDQTFLNKAAQNFKTSRQTRNAHFDFSQRFPDRFVIKHFAGDVAYTVDHFLDKNRDLLDPVLAQCMASSRNALVARLFNEAPAPSGGGGGAKKKKKLKSIGSKFHQQLAQLMTTLHATQPHFIRCVKPNSSKAPMTFEGALSLRQLKYAGLFEAIRIRKCGYAYRIPHGVFLQRHGFVFPAVMRGNHSNSHSKATALMEAMQAEGLLGGEGEAWAVGATRVFLRTADDRTRIEQFRMAKVAHLVVRMQAVVRGFLARYRVFGNRQAAGKVRERRDKAALKIQRMVRGHRTRRWFKRARAVLLFRQAVAQRDARRIRGFLETVRRLTHMIPRREVDAAEQLLGEIEGEQALLDGLTRAVHAADLEEAQRILAELPHSPLQFHDVVLAAKEWVRTQEERDGLEEQLLAMVQQGVDLDAGLDASGLLERAVAAGADADLLRLARDALAEAGPEVHARRMVRLGVETANPNLIHAGVAELEEAGLLRGRALDDVAAGRNMLRMLALEAQLTSGEHHQLAPSVIDACEAVALAIGPDEKTRTKAELRSLVGTRQELEHAVRTFKWIRLYASWRHNREEDTRDDRSFFGFAPPSEMPEVDSASVRGDGSAEHPRRRRRKEAKRNNAALLSGAPPSQRLIGPRHRPQTTQERTRKAAVPRQARRKKAQIWGERTDFIQGRLQASRKALQRKERELAETRAKMEVNGTQGRMWRP